MRRHPAKVDSNHHELVTIARRLGAIVESIPGSANSPGRPDLLVGFGGTWRVWEIKPDKGKLKPKQRAWHEVALRDRLPVEVVRTPRDVLLALGFTPSD